MRLVLAAILSLVLSFFPARAEQVAGMGWNKATACRQAMSKSILKMEIPSDEIACKMSSDPRCAESANLEDFYTTEECVCSDRTPEIPEYIHDKTKHDPERWVCTVKFYKTPGKW